MKFALPLAIAALALLSACDRAPANVQTLITTSCGQTWSVIKAGERIPTSVGPCEYKAVLPSYPMQGDAEFTAQFDGNVLVRVKLSYDYEIVDAIKYIGEAKFLGKASSSADQASSGTALAAYEAAENQVIDKRLRELTTSETVKQDVVEFNSAQFEAALEKAGKAELLTRGVQLNNITFVMVPEEQTRMAIDAATAMNVYKNKGLIDFGQKLAIARAGATKITIETQDKK